MRHILRISRDRNVFRNVSEDERKAIYAACSAVFRAACGPEYSDIETSSLRAGASGLCAELLFTDDGTIKEYNSRFRQIDRATDVLSFPFFSFENGKTEVGAADIDPDTDMADLGNIVISVERAARQAEEYGHSLKREIAFLTAHSCLHLLGYDHETEKDAKMMEKLQEEMLRGLGITRDD
jgi:probable rRNA maturation factor